LRKAALYTKKEKQELALPTSHKFCHFITNFNQTFQNYGKKSMFSWFGAMLFKNLSKDEINRISLTSLHSWKLGLNELLAGNPVDPAGEGSKTGRIFKFR